MTRFLAVSPRLFVPEVPTTVRFYLEVLGFDDWSGWPEEAPTFAIVAKDGVTVQFQQADRAATSAGQTTTLHITVADVPAVLERLGGRLPVEWGPEVYAYGRREFAVRDCNGVMVIFSEETSEPSSCNLDE